MNIKEFKRNYQGKYYIRDFEFAFWIIYIKKVATQEIQNDNRFVFRCIIDYLNYPKENFHSKPVFLGNTYIKVGEKCFTDGTFKKITKSQFINTMCKYKFNNIIRKKT